MEEEQQPDPATGAETTHVDTEVPPTPSDPAASGRFRVLYDAGPYADYPAYVEGRWWFPDSQYILDAATTERLRAVPNFRVLGPVAPPPTPTPEA